MKTEDEARKLWCPFSMAEGQGAAASHNRPDMSYNCIASGCMAWRWGKPATWKEGAIHRHKNPEDAIAAGEQIPAQGYCGLAGKHE